LLRVFQNVLEKLKIAFGVLSGSAGSVQGETANPAAKAMPIHLIGLSVGYEVSLCDGLTLLGASGERNLDKIVNHETKCEAATDLLRPTVVPQY
jgi:hypothetical protein